MENSRAEVRTSNRGSMIDYDIVGAPTEVQQEIDRLIKNYPYFGYETRVISDTRQEGKRFAIVSRWLSCD